MYKFYFIIVSNSHAMLKEKEREIKSVRDLGVWLEVMLFVHLEKITR